MSFTPQFRGLPLRGMRVAAAPILLLAVACGNDEAARSALSTWITVPEYQFGDAIEGNVIWQRPLVRADPPRNRVLVLDPESSQVSEWTPEGSLGFVVGRVGEGPGEFVSPQALFIEADGSFSVLEGEGSRFTYFTASGDLLESIQGPGRRIGYQGFRVSLAWPRNGVYLGVPRIPLDIELGLRGDDPIRHQPLLRVRASENRQSYDNPQPLLWLDRQDRAIVLQEESGSRSFGRQPFGGADQVRFEPGSAVVMKTKEVLGAVELIEVDIAGDTVWHRHLQFEPRRLTTRMVEDRVEGFVNATADDYEEIASISSQELRDMYYRSLYKPVYLPAADGRPMLAASRDVWIRTHEVSDTLRTYYVVRRGDANGEPRRVLLPEWLQISDATETHVWGIWRDSMDVPHVVGRKLVPLSAIE